MRIKRGGHGSVAAELRGRLRGTETAEIVAPSNVDRNIQPRLFGDNISSITISVVRRRAQQGAA